MERCYLKQKGLGQRQIEELEGVPRTGDLFCIDLEHTLTYKQNQKLEQIARKEKTTRENVIKGIVKMYFKDYWGLP